MKFTSELGTISLTYEDDFQVRSMSLNVTNTNPMGVFSFFLRLSSTVNLSTCSFTVPFLMWIKVTECGTSVHGALLCPLSQNFRFSCNRQTFTSGLTCQVELITAALGFARRSTRRRRIISNSSSCEYQISSDTWPMLGRVKFPATFSNDLDLRQKSRGDVAALD